MPTIAKTDLIKGVAAETGVSAGKAKTVIEAFLDATEKHLSQGDTVQITGFGSFEVRERKAREGVRPGTTEKIQIPASKYPAFKAGKSLKDSLK